MADDSESNSDAKSCAPFEKKMHRDWAVSGGGGMKARGAGHMTASKEVMAMPLPLVADFTQHKLPIR